MAPEVLVAVFSLCGTLIGSLAGIMTANKLMNYRIEQLEKKVDKHNSMIERMYNVEEKIAVMDEKIKVANNRICDLEKGDDGR
jgi:hypothetical protein